MHPLINFPLLSKFLRLDVVALKILGIEHLPFRDVGAEERNQHPCEINVVSVRDSVGKSVNVGAQEINNGQPKRVEDMDLS